MKKISYQRSECHGEYEPVENSLLGFIYDLPYFGACGIFPPLQIANGIFSSGGGDGGMSPGAIWEPFRISEGEYQALVRAVKTTDPRQLKGLSRYIDTRFRFDSAFDHIHDEVEWMTAVCDKHREAYHLRKRSKA